jgi:hypothetical protein
MPKPKRSNRNSSERDAPRIKAEPGNGNGNPGHRVSNHAGEPTGANTGAN